MATVRPDPEANSLTEEEKDCLAALKHHWDWDSAYSKAQSTRPQTIGYGLSDSPPAKPPGSWRNSGPEPIATATPRMGLPATRWWTIS